MHATNSTLEAALSAWGGIVGCDYVSTDDKVVQSVSKATFATGQRVLAVVRPANRQEVQQCVRVANRYGVALYPISTGKNWGYGSCVPVRDESVLLDLGRLNRIVDYNEKLAYITVEPGVTFRQVYDFLGARESRLRLNTTGSTSQSSLIGNVLERGLGSGEYADRFAHVCDMEVVLPTGECIQTGFGRFASVRTAGVSRWGVGPYVDGIFTQSNLGIVTRMTFWLMPPAEFSRICIFSIKSSAKLPALIDTIQGLKFQGICADAPRIYNDYKRLAGAIQFPWEAAGTSTHLSRQLMEPIRQALGLGAWSGELHINRSNSRQGLLECELIADALRYKVDTLDFYSDLSQATGRHQSGTFHDAQNGSAQVDAPTATQPLPGSSGIRSVYWRKKQAVPADINPDRDGCGVLWCAPMLPFEGKDVERAVQLIERIILRHEYEPCITLTGITERSMVANAVLMYDRDVAGQDNKAMFCYEDLLEQLVQHGYIPYRLGIQSMHVMSYSQDDYAGFLRRLKDALDPNGILSPGRYLPENKQRSNDNAGTRY